MAVEETYRCIVCGKPKEGSNHWHLAWQTADGALVFTGWDAATARRPEVACICGQGCSHKVLDRHFSARESQG